MDMYFIALVAPHEIDERVLKWKNFMKENYGCTVALKSPAHITLIPPFWMQPGLEGALKDSIRNFSSQQKNFELRLQDFSAFKPRVIYVEVIKNNILDSLQASFLEQLLSENKYPVKRDNRPFHPHITIATRDLYKKAFYQAWETFDSERFKASWEVDSISLLRHNKKNWDVIFTSQFPQ